MFKADDFFELNKNRFSGIFEGTDHVWEALPKIAPFIKSIIKPNVSELRKGKNIIANTSVVYKGNVIEHGFTINSTEASKNNLSISVNGETLKGASLVFAGAYIMSDDIEIGEGTVIEPGAYVSGPSIIGNFVEIRHSAYIRGNVIIGDNSVVGHTTEIKSSIMLGNSKAGHFAYIGDSILGKVNLGAGTKLANLKIVGDEVSIKANGKLYKTNLRKFGAIIADGVETGCNSVTTPGTMLGKNVLVYPNTMTKGYHPSNTIIKLKQNQELKEKD